MCQKKKKPRREKLISFGKSLLTCPDFDEMGSGSTNSCWSNATELIADWCCADMLNTVCVTHHHPLPQNKTMYPFFMVRLRSWVTARKCHFPTAAEAASPLQTAPCRQSWPDHAPSFSQDIDPNWLLAWVFSLPYCFDNAIATWHLFACCLCLPKWTLSPRYKSCVGACDSWCHSSPLRMSQRIRSAVISLGVT